MQERSVNGDSYTQEVEESPKRRRRRHSKRTSLMPWYAKLGITLVLLGVSLIGGLIVGYNVIGHGTFADVFNFQTYKHMYDLVFKTS